MKKKDQIYIPHQDTWTEHFPIRAVTKMITLYT